MYRLTPCAANGLFLVGVFDVNTVETCSRHTCSNGCCQQYLEWLAVGKRLLLSIDIIHWVRLHHSHVQSHVDLAFWFTLNVSASWE
jgi:hypothetical protein